MNVRYMCCALTALVPFLTIRAADAPAEVTVIKLLVEAKAAPTPALKYLLLPEMKDKQQGNSIQAFYKCFMEQNHFYFNKESVEEREKWQKCPLSELPASLCDYGGSSLRQADYAARLNVCDWQLLNQLKHEGVFTLLPDLQQLRILASALKVRYRAQINAGKFDEAVKTHQTIFALAKNLGEHPCLIGNLVGIAVAQHAISAFEEMIQQPGSPNFYWALVQLPPTLMDVHQGLQGERFLVFGDLGPLADPLRVWADDEIILSRAKAKLYFAMLGFQSEELQKGETWVRDRLKDEKWLFNTRKQLIDGGLPAAKVNKYPSEQVMFHNLQTKCEIARDNLIKWSPLPYWQSEDEMIKVEKQRGLGFEDTIVNSMALGLRKVRVSYVRHEQRLAMLRVIEALRLYAADNGGKLPASLADVKYPLPIDPISGKPFIYKLEAGTAIVQNTPPKDSEKSAPHNIRYEITIREAPRNNKLP